jgi:hypothetical protein
MLLIGFGYKAGLLIEGLSLSKGLRGWIEWPAM